MVWVLQGLKPTPAVECMRRSWQVKHERWIYEGLCYPQNGFWTVYEVQGMKKWKCVGPKKANSITADAPYGHIEYFGFQSSQDITNWPQM